MSHKPQATSHKPQATSHKPQAKLLVCTLVFLSFGSCIPQKIAGYTAAKLIENSGLNTASGAGTNTVTVTVTSTGSSTTRGIWDLEIAFPGAGIYSGIKNAPAQSKLCSGTKVNGITGNAICDSYLFDQIMASGMLKDPGATPAQMTLAQEKAAGNSLASGYRQIPQVLKDDEGVLGTTYASYVVRGTAVWNGAVPRVVCGMGFATVADRIKDCDAQHLTKPSWDASSTDNKISWDGSISGTSSEGSWTLVTLYDSTLSNGATCTANCREVWRDDRTGLLWSDQLGDQTANTNQGKFNWCVASGNTENAGTIDCTVGTTNSYNKQGISLCAEETGLTTPNGIHSTTAANDLSSWANSGTSIRDAKGGMMKTANTDPAGAAQSPSVRWRLPTYKDWTLALTNGANNVLKNMASSYFWSASVSSSSRNNAWLVSIGNVYISSRSNTYNVRCVGR